jgi:hypothetical protein
VRWRRRRRFIEFIGDDFVIIFVRFFVVLFYFLVLFIQRSLSEL